MPPNLTLDLVPLGRLLASKLVQQCLPCPFLIRLERLVLLFQVADLGIALLDGGAKLLDGRF